MGRSITDAYPLWSSRQNPFALLSSSYHTHKPNRGINTLRNVWPHDLVDPLLTQSQLHCFLDPSVHATDVVLADRGFGRVLLVDVEQYPDPLGLSTLGPLMLTTLMILLRRLDLPLHNLRVHVELIVVSVPLLRRLHYRCRRV